jgi:hypothetical protein
VCKKLQFLRFLYKYCALGSSCTCILDNNGKFKTMELNTINYGLADYVYISLLVVLWLKDGLTSLALPVPRVWHGIPPPPVCSTVSHLILRFWGPTSATFWLREKLIHYKVTSVHPKFSGLSHNEINNNKKTTNTHWEATQRVMAAKLTRLTHKIAVQCT